MKIIKKQIILPSVGIFAKDKMEDSEQYMKFKNNVLKKFLKDIKKSIKSLIMREMKFRMITYYN